MISQGEAAICRFFRLIPDAPEPRRADPSADGMVPTRGFRYCAALSSASAFGWYIYPPLNFSLFFDGTEINWTYDGAEGWFPLRGTQAPGFRTFFEKAAPDRVKSLAPTFLSASREPGVVQIWSGLLACTAPGWALLCRAPANIPRHQNYEHYEGIVQTEKWFGPLFTNIRLTRTNSPLEFNKRYPLFQAQPLLHQCYLNPPFEVSNLADLSDADWDRFEATMQPNTDKNRMLGHYAVDTRRRLRQSPANPSLEQTAEGERGSG